jgi:hypothetical protein
MVAVLVKKDADTTAGVYSRWNCSKCDFFCFFLGSPSTNSCPRHPHCEMLLSSQDSLANLMADFQGDGNSPNF